MNNCPLCENEKCRASNLLCFWNSKEPDGWCLTYHNAYNAGRIDAINECTAKVRKVIEGYKDVKPFGESD